jgi:hypothetical protein
VSLAAGQHLYVVVGVEIVTIVLRLLDSAFYGSKGWCPGLKAVNKGVPFRGLKAPAPSGRVVLKSVMRGPVNADADPLPRDAKFPKTLIMREIECAANHSTPQSVYG